MLGTKFSRHFWCDVSGIAARTLILIIIVEFAYSSHGRGLRPSDYCGIRYHAHLLTLRGGSSYRQNPSEHAIHGRSRGSGAKGAGTDDDTAENESEEGESLPEELPMQMPDSNDTGENQTACVPVLHDEVPHRLAVRERDEWLSLFHRMKDFRSVFSLDDIRKTLASTGAECVDKQTLKFVAYLAECYMYKVMDHATDWASVRLDGEFEEEHGAEVKNRGEDVDRQMRRFNFTLEEVDLLHAINEIHPDMDLEYLRVPFYLDDPAMVVSSTSSESDSEEMEDNPIPKEDRGKLQQILDENTNGVGTREDARAKEGEGMADESASEVSETSTDSELDSADKVRVHDDADTKQKDGTKGENENRGRDSQESIDYVSVDLDDFIQADLTTEPPDTDPEAQIDGYYPVKPPKPGSLMSLDDLELVSPVGTELQPDYDYQNQGGNVPTHIPMQQQPGGQYMPRPGSMPGQGQPGYGQWQQSAAAQHQNVPGYGQQYPARPGVQYPQAGFPYYAQAVAGGHHPPYQQAQYRMNQPLQPGQDGGQPPQQTPNYAPGAPGNNPNPVMYQHAQYQRAQSQVIYGQNPSAQQQKMAAPPIPATYGGVPGRYPPAAGYQGVPVQAQGVPLGQQTPQQNVQQYQLQQQYRQQQYQMQQQAVAAQYQQQKAQQYQQQQQQAAHAHMQQQQQGGKGF